MNIKGKVFVFGDNVNTDEIIPARFLSTSDPKELAKHCMEDIAPGFGRREDIEGGILVAGENFGCGSSREHAPIAIKAVGIRCVVARSFARIFLRNAINIGLPVVELNRDVSIEDQDDLEIDFEYGLVINHSRKEKYNIEPYPEFLQEIVQMGSWLEYAKKERKGGVMEYLNEIASYPYRIENRRY